MSFCVTANDSFWVCSKIIYDIMTYIMTDVFHIQFFYRGELRSVLSPQFLLPKSYRFVIMHIAYNNSKIRGISTLISTLLFWIAIVKIFIRNVFNKIMIGFYLFTLYLKTLFKVQTQDLTLCKSWRRALTVIYSYPAKTTCFLRYCYFNLVCFLVYVIDNRYITHYSNFAITKIVN